jgi:hypothetical protein
MTVKVFQQNFIHEWDIIKEFEEKVISITAIDGNYIVVLEKEDYFGKLVYMYDMNEYKIEIMPSIN